MLEAVETVGAPKAIGPYSQAIKIGQLLFVSGQLPLDAATGALVSDEAAAQARRCLENLSAIVRAAGTTPDQVAKTTVLLTDLADFAAVNAVYSEHFKAPYPARACYEVKALPRGAKVEIEAIVAFS